MILGSLMFSISAWSCLVPQIQDLALFFEGVSKWTEVQNDKSFLLALKRPVFLNIALKKDQNTEIRWGSDKIKGEDIQLCWRNSKKDKLQITKGFMRVTLVKVEPGLLKSWIPFDGDLFYRKDSQVIQPKVKARSLAEDS